MNEHPLDLHPELCVDFAEAYTSAAYMDAAQARERAAAEEMDAAISNMEAVKADKLAKLAFARFISSLKHQKKNRSSAAISHSVAAEIRAMQLERKALRLKRLANFLRKESHAASKWAAQLATSAESSFDIVFSGNGARLLYKDVL